LSESQLSAQLLESVDSGASIQQVVSPGYARNTDDPENMFPMLLDVAFEMMFKVRTRAHSSSGGVVEMQQYRLIVDAGSIMMGVELEDREENPLHEHEAFAALAKIADVYRVKFPKSYDSHEVFRNLEAGRSNPSRYINEIRTQKIKSMIRSGQIVLSERGALDGTAEEHNLSPDVVSLRNQQIKASIREKFTENADNHDNHRSSVLDTPVVEESAEVSPVFEASKEPAEEPSNWWLWLIGALIVLGGVGLAVRRKS
jgi:hypothetical protein